MNDTIQSLKGLIDSHDKRISSLEKMLNQNGNNDKIDSETSTDLVLQIVNKINDCDETEPLVSILEGRARQPKVMMCFYISWKYFSNARISSSNVDRITTELGSKIDQRNATNVLKEIRKYLESDTARKKGIKVSYRLNRQGVKFFEAILNDKRQAITSK